MEQNLTQPNSPLPVGNEASRLTHWNDQMLIMSAEPIAFMEGTDAATHQEAAEHHFVDIWEQEQALLELSVAKIEGRESTITDSDLQELGLSDRVTKKSSTLAHELYRRMGATNDMNRSDVFLTGLAGLVVEEAATTAMPGFGELYDADADPIERSFAIISAFASRLGEQPELVDGKERDMLLAAELLSEALRAPEGVRGKLGVVAGIEADSLSKDFYTHNIVQICDAVISQIKPKLAGSPEGLSKGKLKERNKNMSCLQSAILTKYDAQFDLLETGQTGQTDGEARQMLASFIAEATEVIDNQELGYAYELFAPIMFRYAALEGGVLDDARAWHATARADMPQDKLGFNPNPQKLTEATHVAQHIKKQSSDIQIGNVSRPDDGTGQPVGRVTQRLQLKARLDAEEVAKEYDDTLVSLHSEDMVNLLSFLDGRLRRADETYNALPDTFQAQEPCKDDVRSEAAEQVVRALVREVGRRINGSPSTPNHEFVASGASTNISVDVPKILDDLILPVYQSMVRQVTDQSAPAERQLVSV